MTERRLPIALTALAMLTMGLAGCLGTDDEDLDQQSVPGLDDQTYPTEDGWSQPLEPAKYDILPGVQRFVEAPDGAELSVGLFLPDIPGCDWNATNLSSECQVPVVIDAGPYFLDGITEPTNRPPKVKWLVPRGYAVAQMSLRGTGESTGCYEFKNPKDVDDISQVITELAEAPWSNGNAGMIGRSYDGTAAWSGAASGNPHLKAIIPISGALDGPHLYYKNGTSETRGFIQPAGYYLYAYGLAAGDPTYRTMDWPTTFCPDAGEDWARGPAAGATGDASSDYWQSRDLSDDIVANYQGAAWVIHGMEDWNVNPSQAVPFTKEMREAGIDTRVWLGQWGHAYPDRIDEHRNVRWDWADKVLTWFDHYLKEEGPQPWLGVEVEDHQYVWRAEDSYPPDDLSWARMDLSADLTLAPQGQGEEGTFLLTGPPSGLAVSGDAAGATGPHAVFTSQPLEEAIRIAGLPRLHVEVAPTTADGGQLFVQLWDVFPDGREVRLGWAAMDLQYHAGGNTDPATLTPGEPVLAKMQFEPMDAHVAQGHQLRLQIDKAGVEDIAPSPNPEPNELQLGPVSTLQLPLIERDVPVGSQISQTTDASTGLGLPGR